MKASAILGIAGLGIGLLALGMIGPSSILTPFAWCLYAGCTYFWVEYEMKWQRKAGMWKK